MNTSPISESIEERVMIILSKDKELLENINDPEVLNSVILLAIAQEEEFIKKVLTSQKIHNAAKNYTMNRVYNKLNNI